jgi:hypothetical protein
VVCVAKMTTTLLNVQWNPISDNYIPPYKRRDHAVGPNMPPGKALVASSEGYHHDHSDEAQAMNAMGGELFNMGASFFEEEEGIDPEFPNDCNTANNYFADLGIASKASVLKTDKDRHHAWIMDSGASHHFTPVREFLYDYKPDNPAHPVRVKVANKQYALRAGVGHILVEPNVEGSEGPNPQYIIKEVWHMPTFSHSLMSTSKLHDAGNWYFSGQTEGDKNLYFLKQGTNRIWLTCRRHKSLNYPDWKIMHASRVKAVSPEVFAASVHSPGAHAPTPTGAHAPTPPVPSQPAEFFA